MITSRCAGAARRSWALLMLIPGGMAAMSARAYADLQVHYQTTEAQLELFGHAQDAPFATTRATVMLQGSKFKADAVDLLGREWRMVGDRQSGKGFMIDGADSTYREVAVFFTCKGVPQRTAAWLAHWIGESGVDSIEVDEPQGAVWNGQTARAITVRFKALLFGAPQPARASLTLTFPVDEPELLGEAVEDVYCGGRPTAEDWTRALESSGVLETPQAQRLAHVLGVPLRIELRSDMGLGKARIVLEAVRIEQTPVDASTFEPPRDFQLIQKKQ